MNIRDPKAPAQDRSAARELKHFIGGKHVAGRDEKSGGRFGDVFNPTTGALAARVPLASKAETGHAIENARQALPGWAETSVLTRARVMFRFKELVERHIDELAMIIASEHGKVLSDAKGSVQRGLEVVEFACGIPHLLKGEYSDNVSAGIDVYSMRQPLGVCAGITPFNFPAMVPMWMFPIAIACGNTFVLKPSEKDPSCSLRLGELMLEAGAPPGVLNVLNGDKEAVETLLNDPRVQAMSFVGSTPVAKYIFATASVNGKRVQSLGGAKNHMVIMPDADIDGAADALMGAAYGSAGERCMAISVAVPVTDRTANELVEAMAPRVKSLKVGPSTDLASEMGPLVTREHRDKVKSYVDLGLKEGAKLVVDGRDFQIAEHPQGFFLGGSLFDNVQPGMRIYKEEIFGPVLSVVRARNFEQALSLPDEHEFGNGVAIFTRNGDVARNFAHKVHCGMVGVNVPIPVPLSFHSFGGWKSSLFGDMNQHGPEGVRFYTRIKTVTARWREGVNPKADFGMPLHGK
ncbi:MAG: methylmalonate-semialdehyde dehydrogenase (acylating) [Betaproteobacteria bacterium RIFCSPLOWO2_02_FULL_65_24]|nr:MAG: methylmalonate-semialdehyde dehydrogenase (acylating) [Betaproteobacteria bacterium RIFCSPLOWO2_02_FULL_65_24]